MKILVNGKWREIMSSNLTIILMELDMEHRTIATAVNERFIPQAARHQLELREGDRLEIVAPMQGG